MEGIDLDGPSGVARIGEATGTVYAARQRSKIASEYLTNQIDLCDEFNDLWPGLFLSENPDVEELAELFPDKFISGEDVQDGFRSRDLRNLHFVNRVFDNVDFSGSDLRGAVFKGSRVTESCNFRNTSFVGANLSGCDFSGCDFTDSVLVRVQAKNAQFCGANLTNCNFSMSLLDDADFSDAVIDGVSFVYADLLTTKMPYPLDWDPSTVYKFYGDRGPFNVNFYGAKTPPPKKKLYDLDGKPLPVETPDLRTRLTWFFVRLGIEVFVRISYGHKHITT